MTDLVVGIDSSTQSCKVLVCDAATLEVVREAKTSHPDGTEVDPQLWWAALAADPGSATHRVHPDWLLLGPVKDKVQGRIKEELEKVLA